MIVVLWEMHLCGVMDDSGGFVVAGAFCCDRGCDFFSAG